MALSIEAPIITETERAFDHLNATLFDGSLIKPIFKFNLKKKARVRFHGSNGPDTGVFEMVVGYGLGVGTVDDFLGDLVHEMVHVQNWLEKVVDCTSNQYHNQSFKEAALVAGLFVIRHKTRGWGVTSLHPSHRSVESAPEDARRDLRIESIRTLRFDRRLLSEVQGQIHEEMANLNQKQFQYKYTCQCPPPHNSVRCGRRPDGPRPLRATCLNCSSPFELDEG